MQPAYIIIFSKTPEDHINIKHIVAIFRKLQLVELKIKPQKCEFFKKEVNFLAFLVGVEGTCCNEEKVQAILQIESPKGVAQLIHFLGLTGFYRKYIDMQKPPDAYASLPEKT